MQISLLIASIHASRCDNLLSVQTRHLSMTSHGICLKIQILPEYSALRSISLHAIINASRHSQISTGIQ